MPAAIAAPVKAQALRHLASGLSSHEVERVMHGKIDQTTVNRLTQKAENRAIIEREQQRIIAKLKNPVDQTLADLDTAAKLAQYFAGEQVDGIDIILTRLGIKYERHEDKDGTIKLVTGQDMGPVLKYYELASKKADKVLASVGMLPSGGGPSQLIQNIYNDHRQQTLINPLVMSALGQFLSQRMDAIDLTPQDTVSDEPGQE